jgi:hypothetical protein
MDRYDIQKGKESEELPIQKTRTYSSTFPEYVENTKVLICFNPDEAQWYIRVKCGKEKDWSEVQVNPGGSRITQNMMFENRYMAEDWCREKGLL